jgi:hypothetical protein
MKRYRGDERVDGIYGFNDRGRNASVPFNWYEVRSKDLNCLKNMLDHSTRQLEQRNKKKREERRSFNTNPAGRIRLSLLELRFVGNSAGSILSYSNEVARSSFLLTPRNTSTECQHEDFSKTFTLLEKEKKV